LVKLIEERPNEFIFSEHLGAIQWISDNKILLENKLRTNALAAEI
jgi:hypothetical protein